MSMKSLVLAVIVMGFQALCLCGQTEMQQYVFCAGTPGCIDLSGPKGSIKLEQPAVLPAGAEFFPDAGIFSWKPTDGQLGKHIIEFTADGNVVRRIEIEVQPLKKALFVFAHGDDEFCIMARMKQLVQQGVEVWCVWTVSNSKVRSGESKAAMAALGIPADRLWFVDFNAVANSTEFSKVVSLLAEFIKEHDFQQIYANAYEGGHVHHDLDHVAAVEAAESAGFKGQIYEFGLYNLYGGKPHVFELIPAAMPSVEIVLDDEGVKVIESLVALYPSQKQVTALFLYGMTPEQKKHARFRTAPKWDYTRRPYKGMMKYEFGLVGYEHMKQKFEDFSKIVMEYYAQKGVKRPDKTIIYEQDKPAAVKTLSAKLAAAPEHVAIK